MLKRIHQGRLSKDISLAIVVIFELTVFTCPTVLFGLIGVPTTLILTLRCLTIGNTAHNYGGQYGWASSGNYTAGLLMECSNETEIAVHDAGQRLASMAHYYDNVFTFGRDMGSGTAHAKFEGNANFRGEVRLDGEQALHPRIRLLDGMKNLTASNWHKLCDFGHNFMDGSYAIRIKWDSGNPHVGHYWPGMATGMVPAASGNNILYNAAPGEYLDLNQYYHHRVVDKFQFLLDSDNYTDNYFGPSYGRMALWVYSYTTTTHHFTVDVRKII